MEFFQMNKDGKGIPGKSESDTARAWSVDWLWGWQESCEKGGL